MTNLLWYILLSIIGLGLIIYTIYKKRNIYHVSTIIVFYFFTAGIAWTGEFIVLGLFNSYAYKTGLFTNVWADNLFGHLLLNTTLYPAIAIIIATNSLGYCGITLVTALFVLIEYFFIKLGAYEHHWWRYYMTAIVVVVFLSISRYWFSRITQNLYGLRRAFIFYFVSMVIIHTPAPILLLLGKQHYQIGWITNFFDDLYLSSIIIIFTYHVVESFLLVLFVCILNKGYWKVAPFIISFVVQFILAKTNILVFTDGWKFVYTIFIYEVFIAAFILLEQYSLKPDTNKFGPSQLNTTQ